MNIPTDIVEDCKNGCREGQKRLYQLVFPYLNSICKRYLNDDNSIKDVLQESFVLLFTKIKQFDPSRASFKTWAVRITINTCIKQNKKDQRFHLVELEPAILQKQTINPKVLDKYSNEEIINFLKKMPEQYFTVFNLYEIEGFSHKEIAELLTINEALSRKRLSRAKNWISDRELILKLKSNC